jgi:hypothetical protein
MNTETPKHTGASTPENDAKGGTSSSTWTKYQMLSILDIADRKIDTTKYLLGDGWLERGDGGIIFSGSGIGKSVISFQCVILWSAGLPAFDIYPKKPLRIIVIQAEDGDNDQTKMAQMIHHLDLSDEQKEMVRTNCSVMTCNDICNAPFFEMLRGMVKDLSPDLIVINPLHSYMGGDVKEDERIKEFLRENLTPLLKKHECGAIIIHHTTKQNYRDTSKWKATDYMYGMAGSAELTNWPRFIVAIEPTEKPDVFKMIAAKRWKRSGWSEPIKHISHSNNPDVMMWQYATDEQVKESKKRETTIEDILEYVTGVDPVEYSRISGQLSLKGHKKKAVDEAIDEAVRAGRLFEDVIRTVTDGKMTHHRPTKGYVRSEPICDIPGDLFSLIPDEGIKPNDLRDKAQDVHGYYPGEVQEHGLTLIRDGKVVQFSGEGSSHSARFLVRTDCVESYQLAHPKALPV